MTVAFILRTNILVEDFRFAAPMHGLCGVVRRDVGKLERGDGAGSVVQTNPNAAGRHVFGTAAFGASAGPSL
jgi:hypothetical protein